MSNQDHSKRFEFVLECPRYGCGTIVATTSTTPASCYCPEHDDWVEMKPEKVEKQDHE